LDLEGNLKWFRGLAYDFPRTGNDVGMSASPVVIGEVVIAQVESQGTSFATGIDKSSGESRWSIPRPRESSWSSPTVMHLTNLARDVVLLQSPARITAHDPTDGKELWAYQVACDAICSSVASEGVVYVPSKGMTALRPDSTAMPQVLWNASGVLPGAASPVVDGEHLFAINRSGVLTCANTVDGQVLSRVRLQGEFWGTPALAGNRLYCLAQDGACQVVEISADGRHAEIVGKNQLDGTLQCSPAICGGALYARSDHHLWKIAAP
jgi:outer membrane protein assembly factor BamB